MITLSGPFERGKDSHPIVGLWFIWHPPQPEIYQITAHIEEMNYFLVQRDADESFRLMHFDHLKICCFYLYRSQAYAEVIKWSDVNRKLKEVKG